MTITTVREAATYACRQKLLVAVTRRYNAHVAWIQAQMRRLDDSPLSLLMSMSLLLSMSWITSVQMPVKGLVHLLPPP